MKVATFFCTLLLAMCSFAQQPQWTVVQHIVAYNQTASIPQTTLFTPSETGLYRITLYFSSRAYVGSTPESIVPQYFGTDASGELIGVGWYMVCEGRSQIAPIPTEVYALEAGQPFTFSLTTNGNNTCIYNLGLVIEQLQ